MRSSLLAVAGAGVAAFGLFLAVAGGVGIAWIGPDGTVAGDEVVLRSGAQALVIPPRVVRGAVTDLGGDTPTLRLRVAGGAPVFAGVAPRAQVDRYLAGARVDEVAGLAPVAVEPLPGAGRTLPAPAAGTWEAAATGGTTLTLTWRVSDGRERAVVVMNADGTAPLDVRLRPAVDVPVLATVAVGVLGVGVLLTLLGGGLLVAGIVGWRSALRRGEPPGGAGPEPAPPA